MGRPRKYPPGQAPSDFRSYHKYVPRPKSARYLAINAGLEELCDLQLERPLSQRDLAQYLGVTQQFVCKIERAALRKLRSRLERIGVKAMPGGRGLDLRAAMRGL